MRALLLWYGYHPSPCSLEDKTVWKQHIPPGGILFPLPQLLHHLSGSRLELALAAVGILVLGSYH